jgi:hypothetical protein
MATVQSRGLRGQQILRKSPANRLSGTEWSIETIDGSFGKTSKEVCYICSYTSHVFIPTLFYLLCFFHLSLHKSQRREKKLTALATKRGTQVDQAGPDGARKRSIAAENQGHAGS